MTTTKWEGTMPTSTTAKATADGKATAKVAAEQKAQAARDKAAQKATPQIAAILRGGENVKLADLVEAVASDLAATGDEIDNGLIVQTGDPVVAHDLLAAYSSQRWDKGRWLGKATANRVKARVAKMRPAE
jgi:hypothetical protein